MRVKPCRECPFRKNATHDGGASVRTYIGQAFGPFVLHCHMDPDYDQRGPNVGVDQCAGAAIFRANVGAPDERVGENARKGLLVLPASPAAFESCAEMVAHFVGVPISEAEALMRLTPPKKLMEDELKKPGVHRAE